MEGLPLRPARRGDIPSLLLLWTALMDEMAKADPRLTPHPKAREHMAGRLAAWINDPEHTLIVAEEGGRMVIGFVAGHIEEGLVWQGARRVGRITDCFVVGPRRRRGIARRLVGRLMDALYQRGAETLRLSVASQAAETRAFWAALAFEELDVVLERDAPPPAASDDAAPAPSRP